MANSDGSASVLLMLYLRGASAKIHATDHVAFVNVAVAVAVAVGVKVAVAVDVGVNVAVPTVEPSATATPPAL